MSEPLRAADGQQVTADGHVRDEAALEEFNASRDIVVCLGTPSYDGNISVGTHAAIVAAVASGIPIAPILRKSSLLCWTFNGLWADALNGREEGGINRFVMLHSDIQPLRPDWLAHLLMLMDRHELDVLSAVVPIKEGRGLDTSTAADGPNGRRRLSRKDLETLPPTFGDKYFRERTGERLLINTGLMAVRFDRPWVEAFSFGIGDSIGRTEEGEFYAQVSPEDWEMSKWLAERAIPYGATQEIPLNHFGEAVYQIGVGK